MLGPWWWWMSYLYFVYSHSPSLVMVSNLAASWRPRMSVFHGSISTCHIVEESAAVILAG